METDGQVGERWCGCETGESYVEFEIGERCGDCDRQVRYSSDGRTVI